MFQNAKMKFPETLREFCSGRNNEWTDNNKWLWLTTEYKLAILRYSVTIKYLYVVIFLSFY